MWYHIIPILGVGSFIFVFGSQVYPILITKYHSQSTGFLYRRIDKEWLKRGMRRDRRLRNGQLNTFTALEFIPDD